MAGIDVWDLELQDTEPDGAISHGHEPLIAFGPINRPAAFTWQRTDPSAEFSRLFPSHAIIYSAVVKSGRPNYQSARIPLQHGLNVPVWKDFLADYHDTRLLEYIEFGFPLGYTAPYPPQQNTRNHVSALNHPTHVRAYLDKEMGFSSILGPFSQQPMDNAHMNPLMSRPKKGTHVRRIIMDLSYALNQASVNAGI